MPQMRIRGQRERRPKRCPVCGADSWFAHLAFEVPEKDASTEWLEPVSDEEYNAL